MNVVMWLFAPFALLVEYPLAALAPAGAFGVAFYFRPGKTVGAAAALWGLYAIYESLMKARVLCSGECNIRVDMLLIAPLLLVISVAALVQLWRKRRA